MAGDDILIITVPLDGFKMIVLQICSPCL